VQIWNDWPEGREKAPGKQTEMPKYVTLDAMIPREDFALEGDENAVHLFSDFPIRNLEQANPILKLLRKPDFQRETNHWTSEQLATFIASFLDNEVIPSLILWKSKSFIFVIDGGHRLSALRAWMENDYGDVAISRAFYGNDLSEDQKTTAGQARTTIEQRVGRFTTLRDLVGTTGDDLQTRRASALFTRAIPVQWIQGSVAVAETSFFKINSQGTPLDETEEMLIRNRRKPMAISARAILRSGAGHKYWSAFGDDHQKMIEVLATHFFTLLFQPEVKEPIRTIDVPLGGSVSPVDALALLVEFLVISGTREAKIKSIAEYADDTTGDETIKILENSLEVVNRITGNSPASLGLHPAVYFYNDKGRYNRFFFLGMTLLLTERLRGNDDAFFKKFTRARARLEKFLIDNKSLITVLPQNMSKAQRIPKMRDLFRFLIDSYDTDNIEITPEKAIAALGLKGRIIDLAAAHTGTQFSDETKSNVFIHKTLEKALTCTICGGLLDPAKSLSYDHIVPRREGGTNEPENADLTHPFCNTGMKN
jgi:hypothetical protein